MVGEPIVLYVCSKCGVKSLCFHMCRKGRIVCDACKSHLLRFIEQNRLEPKDPRYTEG